MSVRWLIILFSIFVALTFVSSWVEHTYAVTTVSTRLDIFMSPSISFSLDGIGKIFAYLSNLWGMITFDYPIFSGSWTYIRYLCMAISIAIGVIFIKDIVQIIRG
jgi:hypothetical protein